MLFRKSTVAFLSCAALGRSNGFIAPSARRLLPSPVFLQRGLKSSRSDKSEYGSGMDQEAMMESDKLIVVDENDVVVPNMEMSKKEAHRFTSHTPRGALHRAFSFFLFVDGKMLLTRRADTKITFPGVWTNTCCSHPLYGMQPDEVDEVPAAFPHFPGIKHSARRKLKHELGIDPSYIKHDEIQFVSRFHYWASDTKTHGKLSPWGEHEVDYVLFYQSDEPEVSPNPDEVAEFKYVTSNELKSLFKNPSLTWSPWFRGIMEGGGFKWWDELEATMAGRNTEETIHFFDPPKQLWADYNLQSHTRNTGVFSSSPTSNVVE